MMLLLLCLVHSPTFLEANYTKRSSNSNNHNIPGRSAVGMCSKCFCLLAQWLVARSDSWPGACICWHARVCVRVCMHTCMFVWVLRSKTTTGVPQVLSTFVWDRFSHWQNLLIRRLDWQAVSPRDLSISTPHLLNYKRVRLHQDL